MQRELLPLVWVSFAGRAFSGLYALILTGFCKNHAKGFDCAIAKRWIATIEHDSKSCMRPDARVGGGLRALVISCSRQYRGINAISAVSWYLLSKVF